MASGTLIPFTLIGNGNGVKQRISIAGSPHQFGAEGHRAFGGTDSSPSPLDYVLGSLISCIQVTSAIIASQDKDIVLGDWNIDIHANLDNSVLVYGNEGISNFRDVHLKIDVQTNLDDERFANFTREVERRCPITQLFRGSGVKFTSKWTNIPS